MNIINDQVEFENADIALLSAKLQTDLQAYAGERLTPAEFLSLRVNNELTNATAVSLGNSLEKLKEAVLSAPALEQEQALDKLEEAADILGIQLLPK